MNEVKNMFLSTSQDSHSKPKALGPADPSSETENSFIPNAVVLEKSINDLKDGHDLAGDLEGLSAIK